MYDADVKNEGATFPKRVLYLGKKGDDPREVAFIQGHIQVQFDAAGIEATVMSSLDDFTAHFDDDGGWPGWCYNVAHRHDIFVVTNTIQGKGNASVIKHALDDGRQVIVWDGQGHFDEVIEVVEVNKRDFQTGWRLELANGEE